MLRKKQVFSYRSTLPHEVHTHTHSILSGDIYSYDVCPEAFPGQLAN